MDELLRNLYGISSMSGNYEERKVENTERANFTLDTARVTDRSWIYETAVCHKNFRNNDWIILEGSNTKEEAIEIHNKWLEFLEKDDYNTLTDCYEEYDYIRQ